MRDAWQILVLDPRTATERDLKAAYARLLKLHRPDQDPEGFQRIRGAYDAALVDLRRRASGNVDENARAQLPMAAGLEESAAETEGPATEEQGPSLEELIYRAKLAFESGDADCVWSTIKNVVEHQHFSTEEETGTARMTLAKLAEHHSGVLHQAVTRDRLLKSLESADASVFLLMCDHWDGTGNTAAPPAVAKYILSQKAFMPSVDGAWALARLGALLGFRHPDLARKLADIAFKHLPTEIRDATVSMVEEEVVLGQIFFGFPPEQQKFWLPRLRHPEAAWDWNDAQSQAAFDYIIKARSNSWAGLPLLCNLLPPEVADALHGAVMEVARRRVAEVANSSGNFDGLEDGLGRIWLFIWGTVFAAIMGLLLLAKIFPELKGSLPGFFR